LAEVYDSNGVRDLGRLVGSIPVFGQTKVRISPRETVPSEGVCLSILEDDTLSGISYGRDPDVLSGSIRCADKESRNESCEEGGELHDGQEEEGWMGYYSSGPGYLYGRMRTTGCFPLMAPNHHPKKLFQLTFKFAEHS
jgi:hypothetical protein